MPTLASLELACCEFEFKLCRRTLVSLLQVCFSQTSNSNSQIVAPCCQTKPQIDQEIQGVTISKRVELAEAGRREYLPAGGFSHLSRFVLCDYLSNVQISIQHARRAIQATLKIKQVNAKEETQVGKNKT